MEVGSEDMSINHAFRDYQLSRVSMKYFTPRDRVIGDNSDHYDALVKAFKDLRAVSNDPDVQMIAEAREALKQAARMALVQEDGLYDFTLAEAFAAETGCKVTLVPPDEDEYYAGHIQSRYGEIFFD